jgi:hypothetical protein
MNRAAQYKRDIASIRNMMEQSTKFISLSGLSGILAGVYCLAGSVAAYYISYYPYPPFSDQLQSINDPLVLAELTGIALLIMFASIVTGIWLSYRKAKRQGRNLWSKASRRLSIKIAVPLIAGGIFALIMICTDHFELAAPTCLIFYGVALLQASDNTFDEVRYLAFSEIILGLIAAVYTGYGLVFWAIGFGFLHIIYGTILYHKYDTPEKVNSTRQTLHAIN